MAATVAACSGTGRPTVPLPWGGSLHPNHVPAALRPRESTPEDAPSPLPGTPEISISLIPPKRGPLKSHKNQSKKQSIKQTN